MLSALKAKRRALAEAQGVPAYVVFTDRTLIEMAETRPATLDAMAGITGVGATKLERYGATFLSVLTGETPDPVHPARRNWPKSPARAPMRRTSPAFWVIATPSGSARRSSKSCGKPEAWRQTTRSAVSDQRRRPGLLSRVVPLARRQRHCDACPTLCCTC